MIDRVVISHKCCGTCGKILVAGYLDQSIASSSVLFPLPLSLSLYIYIYVCVCVCVCVCVYVLPFPFTFTLCNHFQVLERHRYLQDFSTLSPQHVHSPYCFRFFSALHTCKCSLSCTHMFYFLSLLNVICLSRI